MFCIFLTTRHTLCTSLTTRHTLCTSLTTRHTPCTSLTTRHTLCTSLTTSSFLYLSNQQIWYVPSTPPQGQQIYIICLYCLTTRYSPKRSEIRFILLFLPFNTGYLYDINHMAKSITGIRVYDKCIYLSRRHEL